MTWMGHPVPLDHMPGIASATEIESLYTATGAEADRIFVTLMIAHHEGGIAMAEHVRTCQHRRGQEVCGGHRLRA